MNQIKSSQTICEQYGLNLIEVILLQSLIKRRKGTLHPYWIQLTLLLPYSTARRLYDELTANEWAIPDEVEADGTIYESMLTDGEIELIAQIELEASSHSALH